MGCCIHLTRRQFLSAAMTLAAVAPSWLLRVAEAVSAPVPVPKTLGRTDALLKEIITTYARVEDDPWILMHGVRALGSSFSVKGERAVDFLCARFLTPQAVNGKTYPQMSLDNQGHTNTFLKTLFEAGIGLDHRFTLEGRQYTVGDIAEGAKALFTFDPKTTNPDDLAWSLIALSRVIPPDKDTWTNAAGQRIRFSDVVRFAFDTLDETTVQFRQAKAKGIMPDANDKVVNFTCGGTHLVYGITTCIGNGYRDHGFPKRLKTHLDLMAWRLEADDRLIDQFYRKAAPPQGNPSGWQAVHALHHNDAKVKFYGHTFEILSYAMKHKLFKPTSTQSQAIERAGTRLAGAVTGIQGVDLFEVRKASRRLYHLLIGDSCHAYHGIRMTPGLNQA